MAKEYILMAELAEHLDMVNLTPDIDLNEVKIYHRNVNRPQMFLTGYEKHFDEERIQIFGELEQHYLLQFTPEQRRCKFERLMATGIPGIIICRGLEAYPEMLEVAEQMRTPVLSSSRTTAAVMVDTIGWINIQFAPSKTMYGVMVDVYGEGILITGVSGVGKSETAIELVKRGHRLVADDLVEISRVSETMLVGQAPQLTRHFVELRGIGVVDVKSLYGVESVKDRSPIDMIINLEEWDPQKSYDRLGLREEYEEILGVKVVRYSVPIRPGRNLAIIIETAAVNNRQKKMGYNAAQALTDRVSAEIKKRQNENK